MEIVLEDLKVRLGAPAVNISIVPQNTVAAQLYEVIGFKSTGKMDEGELVYNMRLL